MECMTCGLMLVASPHLARSQQHLRLPGNFVEVQHFEGSCVCCNHELEVSFQFDPHSNLERSLYINARYARILSAIIVIYIFMRLYRVVLAA